MNSLPLKGWPNIVVPYLEDLISNSIASKKIIEFYIGRSNDLIQSSYRHGCDCITALYETESISNALFVEQNLINLFWEHQKCNNLSFHCGGGVSNEYINYIYIAIWTKH